MNKMPFCANCGAEMVPNTNFCTNCGTKVQQPSSTSMQVQDQNETSTNVSKRDDIIHIVFIILIVGAACLLTYSLYSLFTADVPDHERISEEARRKVEAEEAEETWREIEDMLRNDENASIPPESQ